MKSEYIVVECNNYDDMTVILRERAKDGWKESGAMKKMDGFFFQILVREKE